MLKILFGRLNSKDCVCKINNTKSTSMIVTVFVIENTINHVFVPWIVWNLRNAAILATLRDTTNRVSLRLWGALTVLQRFFAYFTFYCKLIWVTYNIAPNTIVTQIRPIGFVVSISQETVNDSNEWQWDMNERVLSCKRTSLFSHQHLGSYDYGAYRGWIGNK